MDRPAGGGRAGEQHPAGQAVRQGLPSPPVQAAGAEIEKRRSALHQEHRPSGAQLWGDLGAVAAAYQGKGGGHCSVGHAPAGHPPGQRPDGHVFKRHCPPSPLLRGGKRASEYPPAPGRGNRRRQGTGGALRTAAQAASGKFPQRLPAVEGPEDHRHRRRKRVRYAFVHLPVPGGNLRKSHHIKVRADLQKGVLFCKSPSYFPYYQYITMWNEFLALFVGKGQFNESALGVKR